MLNNKKAQSLSQKIEKPAILVITVVVLFLVYQGLIPEAQSAGDSLNVSNRCADIGCFYNNSAPLNELAGCRINSSPEGNATGCASSLGPEIPLANLFSGTGVVILLLMVGLIFVIIKTVMPKGKKQ